MEPSLQLGEIAGVKVGAHWSVLAIWWLLTWSLATALLPDAAGGHSDLAYWLTGSVAAVALLGCLLAHELSHALVARRHGVGTEAITLWAFGGVAQLREEAPSPRAEFAIAAVGPATSFGLAALAAVLLVVLDLLGTPDLVLTAVSWLAVVNVVLALFNLLPGVPLDGGRVLHAHLWARSGDRRAAVRTAARLGRGLGYALIAVGLLEFTAGYWQGLWLVFIGWFLLSAATAEAQLSGLKDDLDGLTAADIMTTDPVLAPDWLSVQELLDDHVLRHRHSTFPIHDRRGHLTGLVTLADIKAVPSTQRATTPVTDIASPIDELSVAGPAEPVLELLTRFGASRHRRVLVLDDDAPGGRPVGIITPTDVARTLEFAALADGRLSPRPRTATAGSLPS